MIKYLVVYNYMKRTKKIYMFSNTINMHYFYDTIKDKWYCIHIVPNCPVKYYGFFRLKYSLTNPFNYKIPKKINIIIGEIDNKICDDMIYLKILNNI